VTIFEYHLFNCLANLSSALHSQRYVEGREDGIERALDLARKASALAPSPISLQNNSGNVVYASPHKVDFGQRWQLDAARPTFSAKTVPRLLLTLSAVFFIVSCLMYLV
jgi:hypothetical protein